MSNPTRYDFDNDRFSYDDELDIITDDSTGQQYTGDGEKIDDD